jgi:hypothetical protein
MLKRPSASFNVKTIVTSLRLANMALSFLIAIILLSVPALPRFAIAATTSIVNPSPSHSSCTDEDCDEDSDESADSNASVSSTEEIHDTHITESFLFRAPIEVGIFIPLPLHFPNGAELNPPHRPPSA